jgi:hypothetical protein
MNFSPLSKVWKDALLRDSVLAPLEVRTHYRGTIGPRHSMTISETPLWNVSNDWQAFTEVESSKRNEVLANIFSLPIKSEK